MRRWAGIFLLLSISVAAAKSSEAAVVAAASCSRANVASAVASAADGDTVLIPGGTCSWTTELDITKGISLIGSGIDSTILQDSVLKDGSSTSSLLGFKVADPKTFRLSGLTIQGVTTDVSVFSKGHLKLEGSAKSFRVDHVKFTNQQTTGIQVAGYSLGVVDHSSFSGDFKQGVVVNHGEWGGFSDGDGSWNEPLHLGTDRAVYIEDCIFTELNTTQSTGAIDGFDGARIVFRYNTLYNQNGTSHGADSHQRGRGTRSIEAYNNTYTFDSGHAVAYVQWIRGGTGVFYNNNITTVVGPNSVVQASNCRDASAGCGGGPSYTPWGTCNGSSPYDQNSNGGYRCVDQPGSGTSNLLSGDPPAPAGWVGNINDPIYLWNNTVNGASRNTVAGSTNVQLGRDYLTETPRPSYSAYTYPHPRVTGSGATAPPSPTNLRILPRQ